MKIIGLTGNIASGKNFVADIFKNLGAKVFDADEEVSNLLDKNTNIIEEIEDYFPSVIIKNKISKKIDREILAKLVFKNINNLEKLQNIIHPVIKKKRYKFIKQCYLNRRKLLILNIPLLFENNIHLECDMSVLVTSSKFVQRQRFIKREQFKGINKNTLVAKFENIIQNQMPNCKKHKLADFIIKNGLGKSFTNAQVNKIYNNLIT